MRFTSSDNFETALPDYYTLDGWAAYKSHDNLIGVDKGGFNPQARRALVDLDLSLRNSRLTYGESFMTILGELISVPGEIRRLFWG